MAALFVGAIACGETPYVRPPDGVARTQRGDTTVVVTTGNGVWGPVHDLVEVLRVPGNTKETTFGRVSALSATADGGVLVYDMKAPEGKILRQFSADGKFVRNIGREGSGPGEYGRTTFEGNAPLGLTPCPDGSLYILDLFGPVIRFSADGKFLSTFRLDRRSAGNEIFVTNDGSIHTPGLFGIGRGGKSFGVRGTFFRYDTTGTLIDSLLPKPWLGSTEGTSWSQHVPRERRLVAHDGRIVVGRTDKLGFLVFDPSGMAAPLIAEVTAEPIVYSQEERTELEAIQKFEAENGGLFEGGRRVDPPDAAVPVPKSKLPAKTIETDIDGRVWIWKSGPSVKQDLHTLAMLNGLKMYGYFAEPDRTMIAFLPDGTFLGEIRVPPRARLTFVGDFAWGTVRDQDDVVTLVKYRLR